MSASTLCVKNSVSNMYDVIFSFSLLQFQVWDFKNSCNSCTFHFGLKEDYGVNYDTTRILQFLFLG